MHEIGALRGSSYSNDNFNSMDWRVKAILKG